MTNNRLRNVFCMCCNEAKVADVDAASIELCDLCYDYAGEENAHTDEGHTGDTKGCQVCAGLQCHATPKEKAAQEEVVVGAKLAEIEELKLELERCRGRLWAAVDNTVLAVKFEDEQRGKFNEVHYKLLKLQGSFQRQS